MGVLGRAAGLFIVQLEGQALRAQGGERGGSRADGSLRNERLWRAAGQSRDSLTVQARSARSGLQGRGGRSLP